jgi:hypothetical protein
MDMKKAQTKSDSAEPHVYIALGLKGTENQYLNLLKYVNNRNGAQVIYQCKSLTYLRVTRESGLRGKSEPAVIGALDCETSEVET